MKPYLIAIYLFFFSFQDDTERVLSNSDLHTLLTHSKNIVPKLTTIKQIDVRRGAKYFDLDESFFKSFYENKKFEYDTAGVLGHFYTKDKILIFINYKKTYECDHGIDSYELFAINKVGQIKAQILINYYDNHITLYSLNFKFISNEQIEISEKTSSEWAILPEAKYDTITERITVLNINKLPFDTLSTKINKRVIEI